MPVRLACLAFIAAGSFLLAGCGPAKLDVSKSYELTMPEDVEGFVLPKQSKAQKVNVEYTSSDSDVEVLLFPSSEAPDETAYKVDKAKALGHQTGKSGSFVVDVPENTEARLVIRGALKSTKVNVKVKN